MTTMDSMPWLGSALAGGALIGLAAALMILLQGRVAGVSGIVAAILPGKGTAQDGRAWRLAFVLGLMAAGWVLQAWAAAPVITLPASPLMLGLAGLLVGIGSRLAGGCTSGHGVCGSARLSWRSMLATLLFILAGGVLFLLAMLAGMWLTDAVTARRQAA